MFILYDNKVEDSTITVSSENPNYTFDVGLRDDRLSRICRTTSDTSQYIRFELPLKTAITDIMIEGHNLTPSAVVTLKAYHDDGFSAEILHSNVLTYNEGYIYDNFIYSETLFYLVDESGNNITDEYGNKIVGSTTQTSYKNYEITITDPSNTDGYIEISKVFLGTHLSVYMDTAMVLDYDSNSTVSKSVSGQVYANRQLAYKKAKFVLSDITPANRILLKSFWNVVDICKPFWLIIWEESLTVEPPIYCCLTKPLSYNKVATEGGLFTCAIEIEECF